MLSIAASPACAEILTFTCAVDRDDGNPFKAAVVRVDTAKESVELVKPDNRFASRAKISDAAIAWDYAGSIDAEQDLFEGSIDRETGKAYMRYYAWVGGGSYQQRAMGGTCRSG